MEMFEKAVRNKLRFTHKGIISYEDLYDLTLTALDSIYKNTNAELKRQSEDSLLGTKSKDTEMLELKIEIIKHVVATKQAENSERLNASKRAKDKQEFLPLLLRKRTRKLCVPSPCRS